MRCSPSRGSSVYVWLAPLRGVGGEVVWGVGDGSVMDYCGGNRGSDFSDRSYSGEEGLFDTEFNTVQKIYPSSSLCFL